jgi:hypothetical protein
MTLAETTMPSGPFYVHLADAIVINRQRKGLYAEITGGRSRGLSNLLIWFERLTLPYALFIDRWARRYNRRGIPIVDGDLMSMELIREPTAPPTHRGRMSREEMTALRRSLGELKRSIARPIKRSEFDGVARRCYAFLTDTEQRELAQGYHLAMTRHFVESVGLAATNAIDYAEQSSGETNRLARTFLRIQCIPFGMPILSPACFDYRAQAVHAEGVGILLNDVPEIPFRERWESR